MRDSETIFKYGDCSSCTASACFRVPSNTASPVVLTKSASSTLSFSVNLSERRERKYHPAPAIAISRTTAATIAGVRDFAFVAAAGCATALELEAAAAGSGPDFCDASTADVTCAPESAATSPDSETAS